MDESQVKAGDFSGNFDIGMQILAVTLVALITYGGGWIFSKNILGSYIGAAIMTGYGEWQMSQRFIGYNQPSLFWRIARKLFKTLVACLIAIPMYYFCGWTLLSLWYGIMAGASGSTVPAFAYYSIHVGLGVVTICFLILISSYIIHVYRYWWDPMLSDR